MSSGMINLEENLPDAIHEASPHHFGLSPSPNLATIGQYADNFTAP
jgi:hypothetical protein